MNKFGSKYEENSTEKIKELTAREYFERAKKVRSLETDPLYMQMIEDAEKRRRAVPPRVEKQFRREGDKYFLKDGEKGLAFEDKGDKLTSKSSNERVTGAIVAIAEARGWSHMDVKGSKEFKRNVWMEGAVHGIKVDGYTPNEQDLAELHARSKRALNKEAGERGLAAEKINPQEITGELVKHGEAPLGFSKGAQSSYFVQVKTDTGVKTVWGASLVNGIRSSGAKEGDHIHVAYQNKGSAKVKEHDNTSDKKAELLYAAAGSVIDKRIKDPVVREAAHDRIRKNINDHAASGKRVPPVQVYDNKVESLLQQVKVGQDRGGQNQGREREKEKGIER
jgi:hypothetical protein